MSGLLSVQPHVPLQCSLIVAKNGDLCKWGGKAVVVIKSTKSAKKNGADFRTILLSLFVFHLLPQELYCSLQLGGGDDDGHIVVVVWLGDDCLIGDVDGIV